MAISTEQWRRLYKHFNQMARLELSDRDLFVSRPGTVSENIVSDLELGLEPNSKWVVCGSMGSGKSSELVHLADRLQGQRVVVGLDLPRSVARVDLLQPAEVLFLIGAAGVQTARAWGQELDQKLINELSVAFHGLLSDSGHSLNVGDIMQGVVLLAASALVPVGPAAAKTIGAVGAGARIAAGVLGSKSSIPLRQPARIAGETRIVREGETELERLREAVDSVLSAISNEQSPVVLVDGLDKLEDRAAIRNLFATTRILAHPRAHVIYTGPITLMLGTDWNATGGVFKRERLSNVAVHKPPFDWVDVPAQKLALGKAAAQQVISRRLAREQLTETDVFELSALEKIIEVSGGLLRDLVHLVNRAIRAALRTSSTIITSDIANTASTELRREYEVTLTTRRVEELIHVRQRGEPSGTSDVSADLLLSNYVLPYSNGRVWFEPHPILSGLRPGL